MSNYIDLPVQGGGSGAGVSSVNSATGALTLVGGGTTTVTTVGQTITISSTGGGGSGTVTSVGLSLPAMFTVSGSPVTTSGTLSATLANQSANLMLASPNGSAGVPSFRSLVAADIPALSYVTSVGLSAPAMFTVSGSPVTSSGSLTLSLASQTANTVFAAPSGSNGTPSFRALVAGDLPAGTGSVTSVSVASANGFAGTVANPTTTPALTLSTTVTGILKGNGTAISAATAGTDYVIPSGSITGTASNITATSNSTLTTLSALSLPYSQVTGGPSGTVTSVGLSVPGAVYSVSGSPVTTSGTISLTLLSQSANTVFASPNGSSGTPVFRSLVTADVPAAGSTGQVQYNNAGAFAGAAQTLVTSAGNINLSPYAYNAALPAAPTSGVTLYTQTLAGANTLSWMNPDGMPTLAQSGLAQKRVRFAFPPPFSSTMTTPGLAVATNGTVAVTTLPSTGTSIYSISPSIVYSSGATAGGVGCLRGNGGNAYTCLRGSTAALGGFYIYYKVAVDTFLANSLAFVGVRSQPGTTPSATQNPSVYTAGSIGMGYDAGDTTWSIIATLNSSTGSKINLGANFPCNTSQTDVYTAEFYCPGGVSYVNYRVVRLNTGDVAEGQITSGLPAATTNLGGPIVAMSNNATAANAGIAFFGYYQETPY